MLELRSPSPPNARLLALGAAILLLVVGGCDPHIDPFRENSWHYSIFGYLNASADTQFVRVEPLRDGELDSAPESINVDVTLTNQSTGRTHSLRDSLFHAPDRHNFYTTADIEPRTSYRLRVRGPDEAESWVQTTIPDTFEPPPVLVPVADCFPNCPTRDPPECFSGGEVESWIALLSLDEVGRVVAVRARYIMERPRGVWSYGHLADTSHTADGSVEAVVNYAEDWCDIPPPDGETTREHERIEIIVAAGSPDWPEFLSLDAGRELLPGVASNVENGAGFLGGVVTDTVVVYPYEE